MVLIFHLIKEQSLPNADLSISAAPTENKMVDLPLMSLSSLPGLVMD